jgi:very-short-patch-repair endonuclease
MGRYDSAAEAFLALMLEAHPLTAGLFEPQGEPGFAMQGGQSARVDFLAASLRIAVEVDGPYHFEPMQYRRDRHKDLELQSRGYLVLRFLAEDVAADFERVRATINRMVLARERHEPSFGV